MRRGLRDSESRHTRECNVSWTLFLHAWVVGEPLDSRLERVYICKLEYICHNNTLIKPAPFLSSRQRNSWILLTIDAVHTASPNSNPHPPARQSSSHGSLHPRI